MASAAASEPTVLSRLDRLDMMLGYLEEMRVGRAAAVRSSGASTTSSGMLTSDGRNSSVGSSPKRFRPIHDVVHEAQLKGTLIDRVHRLEIRLFKLEEEMENEKRSSPSGGGEKRAHGKGLRHLVKSCVKGNAKEKG